MAVRGPTAPVPLMSQSRTALIAAALVTIGPVSLTMYTPAMPTLVEAFGTTETQVKATLTVFFFGFAFSQLVCGPLSDAFGRRPVALGFFGAYLAGSVVTVMATSMEVLIAGRLLQGIGCAAGIAISRAIVRDQYVGQASARIMNLVGTMLAIAPAISRTRAGWCWHWPTGMASLSSCACTACCSWSCSSGSCRKRTARETARWSALPASCTAMGRCWAAVPSCGRGW